MNPVNILFVIIWAFWCLSEVFLNRLFRSGKQNSENLDKLSLTWIWVVVIFSINAGVYLSVVTNFPFYTSPLVSYGGLILIAVGIAIRFQAIRTLGQYFSVVLSVSKKHPEVRTGLYRDRLEESLLMERIGTEYSDYMNLPNDLSQKYIER